MGRLVLILLLSLISSYSIAKNWDQAQINPQEQQFWQDGIVSSCCGAADAWWADYWEVQPDGSWNVWVDDQRTIQGRYADRDGKMYNVSPDKLKFYPPNTTGHGLLFIHNSNDTVYCYFPGAGG